MLCFECIEKKECAPSAFQLFYETCDECGKKCTSVAYPLEKRKEKRSN